MSLKRTRYAISGLPSKVNADECWPLFKLARLHAAVSSGHDRPLFSRGCMRRLGSPHADFHFVIRMLNLHRGIHGAVAHRHVLCRCPEFCFPSRFLEK